jgi:hypothetical protein
VANQPLIITPEGHGASVLTGIPAKRLSTAPPVRRHGRRWAAGILLLVVFLWAGDEGISLLIQHTGLRERFTTRLSASLGRPVEVEEYDFSLWTGPTIEAQSVTVAEDPRFGNEYFMRADSLSARLGWKSLLRGHIELATLSLTHPSLNVVRDASGDWNIGEWLPKPGAGASQNSSNSGSSLRFKRIDVEGGRINFKQSDVKLPFAFIDVTGSVGTEQPGRWWLDIDAAPWRAPVLTQQAGTIHVSGQVGGTSSRLLPAALDISWTDASVSDVLRLARGDDYGVRGNLGLVLSAKTESSVWDLRGRAEVRQLHRWDLALRGDNPSLNVIAQMKFDPRPGDFELTQATLEAPHSNAQASGKISLDANESTQKTGVAPFSLALSDSAIDLNDLLTWVRAFRGNVAETVSLRGLASVSGSASGWPPHLESAHIVTRGADLVGQGVRVPVHLGAGEFDYDRGQASMLPVVITFGPKGAPEGSFRIDALLRSGTKRPASLRLAGNIAQVRDITTAAGMFGWNLSRGWDVAGPFQCDLRWQTAQGPPVRGSSVTGSSVTGSSVTGSSVKVRGWCSLSARWSLVERMGVKPIFALPF